jgi:hypothetical protein
MSEALMSKFLSNGDGIKGYIKVICLLKVEKRNRFKKNP